MFRLLKLRNARLYLAGQTLSLFGDTALWLAMGIWVKSLTGSNAAAGLVFFAFALPSLGAPVFGLLVDRMYRRPLLIVTNIIIGIIVLLLLLVHDQSNIWLIYSVMFLYGISSSIIGSAQSAFLTVLVPDDLLGEANSTLQSISQGLRLVGPLVGAGLFAWLGGGIVAIVDALTFFLAALAVFLVQVKEPQLELSKQHWVGEVLAGVNHIKDTVVLRQLIVASASVMLVIGFAEVVFFAVVDGGLHRPPTFIGVLVALQGVGGLLGGVTAAIVMRRIAEGVLSGLGIMFLALGILLLNIPLLITVFAGMVLFGLGLPWLVVGVYTLVQRATPPGLQGRVYSAVDVFTGIPRTISIALGAVLITFINYRVLLLFMTIVLGCSSVYLLTRTEQRKHKIELPVLESSSDVSRDNGKEYL